MRTAVLWVLLAFGAGSVSLGGWAAPAFRALIFLWLAATAGWMAWTGEKPVWHRILLPLAGCMVWGVAQQMAEGTVYGFDTGAQILAWASRLALAWLALQTCRRRDSRQPLLTGLAAGGGILSALALVHFYTARGRLWWIVQTNYPDDPVLLSFLNRDQYAALIEMLLPVVVWLAWTERRRMWLWSAAAGVMFASVLAGGSRAGTVLAGAEIVITSLLATRRRRQPLLLRWALPSVLVSLAVAVVGLEVTGARWTGGDPLAIRRDLWISTVRMIADRPITGHGLGTWAVVYPAYARIDPGAWANHAHNDWLEWTSDGGIVMLALLLWLAFETIRALPRGAWALGLVAVGIHSLVDFPLQGDVLAALWLVLAGTLLSQSVRSRVRQSTTLVAGGIPHRHGHQHPHCHPVS